jgi:hypothetical protein
MSVSEFQAWLKGYAEAIGGEAPTAEQWKRVQDEAGKINKPAEYNLRGGAGEAGWSAEFRANATTVSALM